MTEKNKYQLRCVKCGAEVFSNSKDRVCYQCDSPMKIIKENKENDNLQN